MNNTSEKHPLSGSVLPGPKFSAEPSRVPFIGGGKSAFTIASSYDPLNLSSLRLSRTLPRDPLEGTPCSPNTSWAGSLIRTSAERTRERHSSSPAVDARYLSVFLDTNSVSIKNYIKDGNIAYFTNVGVSEEYRRTDNYKGGLHLIMRALGKSYSLDRVSVLSSEIDISDFKTPALDESSHVFGRLVDHQFIKNISLDGDPKDVSALKKNLDLVYKLLSGIAYVRLYSDESMATHHQVKAAYIRERFATFPESIINGIDRLMNVTDTNTNTWAVEIKAFMTLLMGSPKEVQCWIKPLNALLQQLSMLDSKRFYEKNQDKIDQQYHVEESSVSIFYWVSRMMYREGLLQTKMKSSAINSTSSPSSKVDHSFLQGTKNLGDMPDHVCSALNTFFDFIYDDFKSKTTLKKPSKHAFKVMLIGVMDDLYTQYTRERAWYADPKDIYDAEQNAMQERFAGTGYSSEYLRISTQRYMENNKAVGQLIDDKFDVNDFALCLDAISNGMPILTHNVKMKEQVWGNLARALILGRDVQFIIIGHLLQDADRPSIEDITAFDVDRYCDKYLDTRHLWTMSDHRVAGELYEDLRALPGVLYIPAPVSPRAPISSSGNASRAVTPSAAPDCVDKTSILSMI